MHTMTDASEMTQEQKQKLADRLVADRFAGLWEKHLHWSAKKQMEFPPMELAKAFFAAGVWAVLDAAQQPSRTLRGT
jgi:hypothetical protein